MKRKTILSAATAAVAAAFIIAGMRNGLTVTHYALETPKLERALRLVLLTDLHDCEYGADQADLLAAIHAQKPDLALMAGDITDCAAPGAGIAALLRGLSARYPCFYTTGNHEWWSGGAARIKGMFRAHGVRVLEGGCAAVEVRGQRINICGVDDPEIGEEAFRLQLQGASASPGRAAYTVLLSHRPERFAQTPRPGADLTLSGHAHGGLWRLPFLRGGLFAPNQGFFPRYTGGVYRGAGGAKMVTGRGLLRSSATLPRIFNPPEIVVIDLMPERGGAE